MSPWAVKRLHEYNGDISQFRVIKVKPSRMKQIAIAKTEPGDENNQDISSLAGKVDIRKLEEFSQDDPDAYSYSGGLCRANRGLLEFVEMFKAPIKVLHPLLTAHKKETIMQLKAYPVFLLKVLLLPTPTNLNGKPFAITKIMKRLSTELTLLRSLIVYVFPKSYEFIGNYLITAR